MAIWKATMLFSQLSAASAPAYPIHRIAGWSESWYMNASSGAGAITTLTADGGLMKTRAAMLCNGASIVGGRIQQVSPLGGSQTFGTSFAGNIQQLGSEPQVGILCRCGGLGTPNIRRFILRGMIQAFTSEGELLDGASWKNLINPFFANLANFQFSARDLTQPKIGIQTIVTVAGVTTVTTNQNVNIGALVQIRILKTRDSGGNLRGGLFYVSVGAANANTFQITGWPYGNTTGGSYRLQVITYPFVDPASTAYVRIVTRRVGRPFTAYRGRRSKRR